MPSISIAGPFDFMSRKLDACVDELIGKGETDIVLDLSETHYLTSRGIATMFKMIKKIQAAGGELHITGATDDMQELIEQGKMDEYITYISN